LPRRLRLLLLAALLAASLRGTDARRLPLATASAALAAAGTAAAPPAPNLLSVVHNRKAPVLATMPTAQYVATATPVAPQLVSRIASAVLGVGLLAAIVAAVLAVANANAPPRGVVAPGGYRGEAAPRELFAPGGAAGERARLLR
jgi:hypothetical protein